MATSVVGKVRLNLKTVLQSVAVLNGERVFLGRKDLKDDNEFFKNINTEGPYAFIGKHSFNGAELRAQDGSFHNFSIEIKVYSGYGAYTDEDFTATDDLISNIKAALQNPSNYPAGAGLGMFPTNIDGAPEDDLELSPRVQLYKFQLEFGNAY